MMGEILSELLSSCVPDEIISSNKTNHSVIIIYRSKMKVFSTKTLFPVLK